MKEFLGAGESLKIDEALWDSGISDPWERMDECQSMDAWRYVREYVYNPVGSAVLVPLEESLYSCVGEFVQDSLGVAA